MPVHKDEYLRFTVSFQVAFLQRVEHTLIPAELLQPVSAYVVRIDHDVDLHRMEPRLCVLITVTLDTNMLIDDHEFD